TPRLPQRRVLRADAEPARRAAMPPVAHEQPEAEKISEINHAHNRPGQVLRLFQPLEPHQQAVLPRIEHQKKQRPGHGMIFGGTLVSPVAWKNSSSRFASPSCSANCSRMLSS